MNALVDTSVWSLALRRKHDDLSTAERAAVAGLNVLVGDGRAKIMGLIRQELLSGIRNASQFEKIRNALRPFLDEPIDTLDHEAAAQANNDCRAKGISVTLVDILICAVAARRDWVIFTVDPDFERYAKILPIKLHQYRDK